MKFTFLEMSDFKQHTSDLQTEKKMHTIFNPRGGGGMSDTAAALEYKFRNHESMKQRKSISLNLKNTTNFKN